MNGLPDSRRWGYSVYRMMSILVLLVLLLTACSPRGTGTPAAASPQVPTHILVSITDPHDGDAYPLSAGLSIRAETIADSSIARMELWADGELHRTYIAPEDGLGYLVHDWDWSPETTGVHTLMVRAYNDQDQSSFSNVVHIKGIADPGFVVLAKADEGEMVGAKAMMAFGQWSALRGKSAQNAPGAPALTATVQGCGAALSITDVSEDEQGFNIYRLAPGAMLFSKVATLPAQSGNGTLSYQDSNIFGLYSYFAAAFDAEGEAAGNLVSLTVADPGCAGETTTIDELASIPAGVEEYYLYLAINDGAWQRFPASDFTYLNKSDDLDFGALAGILAPNLAGEFSMRGEVWGMLGRTATLLGVFDKSFKANQPPATFAPPILSLFSSTKLEVRGVFNPSTGKYPWLVEKGTAYGVETFRFGTDTGAAVGVWQVASAPFSSEPGFKPACLLLTGKTDGSGTPNDPIQFSVDFTSLKPKIEQVSLSPFENLIGQNPAFFAPFSPGKLDASPGGQVVSNPPWNGAMIDAGSVTLVNYDPCAQNVSAEGVTTYYVRVLPVTDGQPAGVPSNMVKIIYDPNNQIKVSITTVLTPTIVYYDVKILEFTGVHVPEWAYEHCVEVVENKAPQGSPWAAYPPGSVLCPSTFTGGSGNILDDLSDAIGEAFDFFAGLYNDLSDWVTDLVEKLNPLCIGANLVTDSVGEGKQEVKDACHFIAVAAVTAAKTYAGLPPTLPNFDQLTEIGKDNLVELAAQELENQGIPCPEACKNVIRKGIDYSLEEVKNSMSNSSCISEEEAHSQGIEPLCLPSYITTKPDARGQPGPAVVQVQVTRRPGTKGVTIPEPKSCNVSINVHAKNDPTGHLYGSAAGFQWAGAPIEGKLFTGTSAFPTLQPGESTTIPIVLDPSSYWLPGHKEFVKKGWEPEHFDDWAILYKGALATVNAGGSCKFVLPEGIGFTDKSVKGDSIQVGPLGNAWSNACAPYDCP